MSVTAPAGKILSALRIHTRIAHARLDRLNLLDEMLEIDNYRKILQKFYGFWQSWEPLARSLLDDEVFFDPRRRLSLLRTDLTVLGLSLDMIGQLSVCPPMLLQNKSEALGSLYVMEGSTLGGRVIQKNVERHLGLTNKSGCHYFAGYGDNTGQMWRQFLQRLETAPETTTDYIVKGALTTFEGLELWFSKDRELC